MKGLRSNNPSCRKNPLKSVRNLIKKRSCSFSLKAAHPDEISEIIKNMKYLKSCGMDNIDSFAITHVVNLNIRNNYFPTSWKTAKVIPLFKKGDATLPKNFCQISLLPITSKILERAVYQQLVKYLEDNTLLHHCHIMDLEKIPVQPQLFWKCIPTGWMLMKKTKTQQLFS